MNGRLFGQHLISRRLVKDCDVTEALIAQKYRKERLGRILKSLGSLDQETLNRELEIFLKLEPSQDIKSLQEKLNTVQVTQEALNWAKKQNVIICQISGNNWEAVSLNFKDEVIEEAHKLWGVNLKYSIVTPDVFSYFFNQVYQNSVSDPLTITVTKGINDDEKIKDPNPYVSLFRECLEEAKKRKISDIHFEPKVFGLQIRLRLHGELITWKTLSIEHRDSFIAKIKWLLNLDLSISGKAQDSRATYYDYKLNVRVNALPTRHGDKIVLRLLDQEKEFDLESLGLDGNTLKAIKKASNLRQGLIIISGPTGSGKTTTLYGLISSLNHRVLNITTLEDPSEYELCGVTQTEVSRHLSFAEALRALMRQDPDVILLGEIRDEETANLSLKMANTGHLVISTLHANGAIESIERLKNLGVDAFSLSSSLCFVGAQRLLKRICPKCALDVNTGNGITFKTRNPKGCSQCEKGIIGRVPVLEYATMEQIRSYLNDSGKTNPLSVSLKEATFQLISKGMVDAREMET